LVADHEADAFNPPVIKDIENSSNYETLIDFLFEGHLQNNNNNNNN
jgi:hypothetical protein